MRCRVRKTATENEEKRRGRWGEEAEKNKKKWKE